MNKAIRVKELCGEYCIDEHDVNQLAAAIITRLKQSEPVILDFEGVDTLLTAFFNGLLGKLFAELDFTTIKESVTFADSTPAIIRDKFQKSLENARVYYTAPQDIQKTIRKKITNIFTEIDPDD